MLKTIFGGAIGIFVAALVGVILIQRIDQIYQERSPNPIPFMLLLAAVGGITGGAIASPLPNIPEK